MHVKGSHRFFFSFQRLCRKFRFDIVRFSELSCRDFSQHQNMTGDGILFVVLVAIKNLNFLYSLETVLKSRKCFSIKTGHSDVSGSSQISETIFQKSQSPFLTIKMSLQWTPCCMSNNLQTFQSTQLIIILLMHSTF